MSGVFAAIAGDGAEAWCFRGIGCEKRDFYVLAVYLDDDAVTCLGYFEFHVLWQSENVKIKVRTYAPQYLTFLHGLSYSSNKHLDKQSKKD